MQLTFEHPESITFVRDLCNTNHHCNSVLNVKPQELKQIIEIDSGALHLKDLLFRAVCHLKQKGCHDLKADLPGVYSQQRESTLALSSQQVMQGIAYVESLLNAFEYLQPELQTTALAILWNPKGKLEVSAPESVSTQGVLQVLNRYCDILSKVPNLVTKPDQEKVKALCGRVFKMNTQVLVRAKAAEAQKTASHISSNDDVQVDNGGGYKK